MSQKWITDPKKLDQLYLEGIKHVLAIETILTQHLASKNNSRETLEDIYIVVGDIVRSWIFSTDKDFPPKELSLQKGRYASYGGYQQFTEKQFADLPANQRRQLFKHRKKFQNIFPEVSQQELGKVSLTHQLNSQSTHTEQKIFEATRGNISRAREKVNEPPLSPEEESILQLIAFQKLWIIPKEFWKEEWGEFKKIRPWKPQVLREVEEKRDEIFSMLEEFQAKQAWPHISGGVESLTYLQEKNKGDENLFKNRVVKIPQNKHTAGNDSPSSSLVVRGFQRGHAPIDNNPNLIPFIIVGTSSLLSDEMLQVLFQNSYAREDSKGFFLRTEMCWCKEKNGEGTLVYHQEKMKLFDRRKERHRRAFDKLLKRSRSEWTRHHKLSRQQRQEQRRFLTDRRSRAVLYPAEDLQGNLVAIGGYDGHYGNIGFKSGSPKYFDCPATLVKPEENPELKSYFERLNEIPKKHRFLPEVHAYQAYEEARYFLGQIRQKDEKWYQKFNAAYSNKIKFPSNPSAAQLDAIGRIDNAMIFKEGQKIARSRQRNK